MNSDPLDQVATPDPVAAYRLFQFGAGGLAAATAWFVWQSGGDLSLQFCLGLAILYLASMPALRWAKTQSPWFPAFEITLLTTVAFYAIPLLNHHSELDAYSPGVIAAAAVQVVVYLAAANLGFSAVRNPVRPSKWACDSLLPEAAIDYLPLGMVINTVYVFCDQFTALNSYSIVGTLRALSYGLGTVSTFVLARQWGLGRIAPHARALFILNLSIQVVLMISQLYLVTAISLLALALIAYSAARRRVPWLLLVIGLPTLAFLHNGKSEMRRVYWEEKKAAPTLLELPAYFGEWIDFSLHREFKDEDARRRASLFERASLIQMLCMSVDRVPETKPYLYGESYVDIPALFIPRFVWPEKPSSLLANARLGIMFDLIDPDDRFKVSIAFGPIAEAYLNFGIVGVAALGLLFGTVFKRVSMLSIGAPQFSTLGILMILLAAWSFQAEFVLATWLSSLFQAAAVCIGAPLIYRRFTNA